MKKVRSVALFLICILLMSECTTPALAAAAPPEIDAKAALLLDPDSGEILYEKKADDMLYPASLTKIMTALLVFEAIDAGALTLDQEITATASAFVGLSSSGSSANIQTGEILTVEQLLACMLINSANEAATILACAVSGTQADFVSRMNSRATELGCDNTHFMNPSGLHDTEHYTTARDLYRITMAAMEHEDFMTFCNSKSWEIPATNLHDARTLHSTNYLISNWRALGYLYSGAQGVKTGHTSEAGYCLVSTARRGDRRLLGIVLGAAKQVYYEGNKKIEKVGSFIEMAELFDWGFDSFSRETLVTKAETVAEARVDLSRETNYVVVHPAEDVERLLPTELSAADLKRSVTMHEEVFLAPIAVGQEMGTLTLSYGDTVYATVPLLAMTDVSASWILTAHHKLVTFFARPMVKVICLALLVLGALLLIRGNGRRRRSQGGAGYPGKKYRGRRF